MSLPIFPRFKKINLDDHKHFDAIVNKYPPYSDFNFTSIYSYQGSEFSILNDNLVIKFRDYLDGKYFYSFIGTNKVVKTSLTLIGYAEKQGLSTLKLIPEISIKKGISSSPHLKCEEDPDNFDYVLKVSDLLRLSKKHYNKTKQFVIFNRLHANHTVRKIDLTDSKAQEDIIEVFDEWRVSKSHSIEETSREKLAIMRIFDAAKHLPFCSIGIYIDNTLIGFAIADVAGEKYSEFHFVKASIKYKGIFAALYIYLAQSIKTYKKSIVYLNIEQDLGIEGLREAKRQWHPHKYLKKYIVSRAER